MNSLTLRDAVESDVSAIHDMANELAVFEDLAHDFVATVVDYRQGIFGPGAPAHVVIAEVDGEVAGMALYFETFTTFLGRTGIWLEDLYVREAFRRRGVASALMNELKHRTNGRLEWEVLDWNEGAIKLYEQTAAEPFTGWKKYRLNPDH